MNKLIVIVAAIAALLGLIYFGGKVAKQSSIVNQPVSNYNQGAMNQSDPIDTMTDSQDDQTLSQISADDNADLTDTNGM